MKINAVYQKITNGFYIVYGEGEIIDNSIGQRAFEFHSGFEMNKKELSDMKGKTSFFVVIHESKSSAQRYLISEVLTRL